MLSLLVSVSVATMAQFGPADADAKYATDLLKPGTAVPDFKLKDVNGRTQRLSKSGPHGAPTAGRISPM